MAIQAYLMYLSGTGLYPVIESERRMQSLE